jgi:hypothetical protein
VGSQIFANFLFLQGVSEPKPCEKQGMPVHTYSHTLTDCLNDGWIDGQNQTGLLLLKTNLMTLPHTFCSDVATKYLIERCSFFTVIV